MIFLSVGNQSECSCGHKILSY